MKRLLIALAVLIVALLPCVAQDVSTDPAQIEAAVDRMLTAMRVNRGISVYADRVDGMVRYGDAAVPILIHKHDEVVEQKLWALVACLCKLPTTESRKFLMGVIRKHINHIATSYAISHYPIQHEGDIVAILIEILPLRVLGHTASDRLCKVILRNPPTAGLLVAELVDDTSSVPRNRKLHNILARVSGYGYFEWPHTNPNGKITTESENGFWRDWWKRNQKKEVFGWLTEALYRDRGGRRSYALQVLGNLNDKRAIPHLVSALDDKEYRIRFSAVRGLKKIEGTNPPGGYLHETFKGEEDRVIAGLKARFGEKTDNKPDAGDGK